MSLVLTLNFASQSHASEDRPETIVVNESLSDNIESRVLTASVLRVELAGDQGFGDMIRLMKQAQQVNHMNESLMLAPNEIEAAASE